MKVSTDKQLRTTPCSGCTWKSGERMQRMWRKSAQLVAKMLLWAWAWAEGLPVQGTAEITGPCGAHLSTPPLVPHQPGVQDADRVWAAGEASAPSAPADYRLTCCVTSGK